MIFENQRLFRSWLIRVSAGARQPVPHGPGPQTARDGPSRPVTLVKVEQCGRAVPPPQAGRRFPAMPGELFRERHGKVPGITRPQSLEDQTLLGGFDADPTVNGVHAGGREELGE
jgi:hypothetical protein